MTETILRADNDVDLGRLHAWLAEQSRQGRWISFDLETRADENSLEDWHPSSRIVSVAFAVSGDVAWVVPLSHPGAPWSDDWEHEAQGLFEILAAGSPRLVGQFVKFDTRWVRSRTGVDLGPFIAWDCKDASYTLNENQPNGLKVRAQEDLGVPAWADAVDLRDAEKVPWVDLATYNGLDAIYTYRLFEWQRERLRQDPALAKVYWNIALPAVRALSQVEHHGLLLDVEEVRRREREARREQADLATRIVDTVPEAVIEQFRDQKKYKPSLAPTSKFFKAYAEASWPVLETTAKGAPSWSSSVLKRLAKRGFENADLLLQYRKLDKQITTYLSSWPDDVTPAGRLHATYKTTSTVTGRLSCERPNLQQVDRKLKTCFIAPPGFRFVQVDYSQIELRIAAHVSGDANLIRAYRDGVDVHTQTAAAVTSKSIEDVESEERYRAKAVNFGFLFGQLAPGFRNYARDVYGVDFTEEESEQARERFFDTYPGLLDYHVLQRRRVRRFKQVTNLFGRVRRLPGIDSPDQLERWAAERQAINAPIQSGANELMLLALARIVEGLRGREDRARVVGTVHDSGLLEVREDVLDRALEWIGGVMVTPEKLWSGLRLTVPLEVEFEIGDRWGDPERTYTMTGQVLEEAVA